MKIADLQPHLHAQRGIEIRERLLEHGPIWPAGHYPPLQPAGPTKTVNSSSSTLRSTPLMTATPAKSLRTCFSSMLPMIVSFAVARSLFHRAERQAAHKLLLREPAEDEDRRDRQHRSRGK